LIVTYRTDPRKLREVVPEVHEPLVKFEFVRMPDSTSFGDYTESGVPIGLERPAQPRLGDRPTRRGPTTRKL
jgi:acetoacetate decarboxylase